MHKKQSPLGLTLSAEHRQYREVYHSKQRARQHKSGTSRRLNRIQTSPGPGSYTITQMSNQTKGISMSKHKEKSDQVARKPDPWTYVPKYNFLETKSPTVKFGRSQKLAKIPRGPGPADYNSNYQYLLQRSRRTVMGQRNKPIMFEKKPGPADYDPLHADKILRKNICITIGHQERSNQSRSLSPGPSDYKVEDLFSSKNKTRTGFTMGSKIRSKTVCEAPDDYLKYNPSKIATLYRSPAYSIKKYTDNSLNRTISPGPAAYSPKHITNGGITIPKSQRTVDITSEGSRLGDYKIAVSDCGPSYSIPREGNKEQTVKQRRPGPADYSPQKPKSQKYQGISMGAIGKRQHQEKRSPGPGEYELPPKKIKGLTIGHQQRRQGSVKASPGPADYNVNYQSLQRFISTKRN